MIDDELGSRTSLLFLCEDPTLTYFYKDEGVMIALLRFLLLLFASSRAAIVINSATPGINLQEVRSLFLPV